MKIKSNTTNNDLPWRFAGMVHAVSGWTRGVQVKLWDPLRTCAIPERLRGAFTMKRYTNPRLPLPFGLYQRASSEENETNSSSGSCHGSDVTWQEICRTCGSVCSCPHPGSQNFAPPYRMCTASLIHLVPLSDSLSRIVACDQLIMWLSRLAWSVKADLFCSDKLCIGADFLWMVSLSLPQLLSYVLLVLSRAFFKSHLCLTYPWP